MPATLAGRILAIRHPLRALARDTRGVTAIEFAFVAPVFFLFVFGILEIALIVFFASLISDGAEQGNRYLRDQTMNCVRQGAAGQGSINCTGATIAGLRQAICGAISVGGMSCAADSLKLAVYPADNPIANPFPSSLMIDETPANLKQSRAYVIAVGYEWPFALSTSTLLLPTQGGRTQIQYRTYSSTAERALR